MQSVIQSVLGCGTKWALGFKDECGFEFRIILKALHKYMLIGLLFLTLVMNFICTLNYVLGVCFLEIGSLKILQFSAGKIILYSCILGEERPESGTRERISALVHVWTCECVRFILLTFIRGRYITFAELFKNAHVSPERIFRKR